MITIVMGFWSIGMLVLKGKFAFTIFSDKIWIANKIKSHFHGTHYSIISVIRPSDCKRREFCHAKDKK